MSQEIMEGIRTIEREKGIETGTLVAALEDALLAAYKKTPGSSRRSRTRSSLPTRRHRVPHATPR